MIDVQAPWRCFGLTVAVFTLSCDEGMLSSSLHQAPASEAAPAPDGVTEGVGETASNEGAVSLLVGILHSAGEHLWPDRDGAVFGRVDFRAPTAEHEQRAGSTAALFCANALDLRSTMEAKLRASCTSECPGIVAISDEIGSFPHAPGSRGGGVLVGPKVVAISKHSAYDFCAPLSSETETGKKTEEDSAQCRGLAGMRVVFGFDQDSEDIRPHAVERICMAPYGDPDLALARLAEPPDGPPIQGDIADDGSTAEVQNVVAFGHPQGSARVMTGDDGETVIHDCSDGGGRIHATLDALDGSSGSPVYIEQPDRGWTLFGLLANAPFGTFFGGDIRRQEAHEDPCMEGFDAGPIIAPLGVIEPEVIENFGAGQDPDGWRCFSAADESIPVSCTDIRAPEL